MALSATVFVAGLSIWLARFTIGSDFPVFYNAASKIIDPTISNSAIYNVDIVNKYMPEQLRLNAFIYSMPVAYILSPLALLPYYTAKSLMIFISIICYLFAIVIILRLNRATDRWFLYPLLLSCLWLPFIHDLRSTQVNCIIFLLVSIASLFATKERAYLCGSLLSFAALFKLFPLAIAMVLGLKNWRIFASFAFVFAASFLIPRSTGWYTAIGNIYQADLMPLYLFTSKFSIVWFGLYVIFVSGLTALIAYRTIITDYPLLISFAIPAVFLTMPILEYYHLTLLIFSYVYLLTSKYKNDRLLIISVIISFVMISVAFFYSRASIHFIESPFLSKSLVTIGLVSLWGVLALKLSAKKI